MEQGFQANLPTSESQWVALLWLYIVLVQMVSFFDGKLAPWSAKLRALVNRIKF